MHTYTSDGTYFSISTDLFLSKASWCMHTYIHTYILTSPFQGIYSWAKQAEISSPPWVCPFLHCLAVEFLCQINANGVNNNCTRAPTPPGRAVIIKRTVGKDSTQRSPHWRPLFWKRWNIQNLAKRNNDQLMHVCMYACMSTTTVHERQLLHRVYAYMYVCMYAYIYIYIYTHTHTHKHTHMK